MISKANEIQVGGTHYQTEYQHWDFMVDMGYGPEYFIAAATKYLCRHKKKAGRADLEKAIHYIAKLIEAVKEGKIKIATLWPFPTEPASSNYQRFIDTNELDDYQQWVFNKLLYYTSVHDLISALGILTEYTQVFYPPNPLPDDEVRYAEGFHAEGYGADVTYWQCQRCGEHLKLLSRVNPASVHGSCATWKYIDQG